MTAECCKRFQVFIYEAPAAVPATAATTSKVPSGSPSGALGNALAPPGGGETGGTSKPSQISLEAFFRYCYEHAAQLDDQKQKSDEDIPRVLMGIRASARVGYFDLTGKWLSVTR